MNAIGYCRVSIEDQAKEGVNLDNQKSKIEAYYQLRDLNLSEIIEDVGIRAKNLKRPGVQRVLKLVRKKQIDTVVVYNWAGYSVQQLMNWESCLLKAISNKHQPILIFIFDLYRLK